MSLRKKNVFAFLLHKCYLKYDFNKDLKMKSKNSYLIWKWFHIKNDIIFKLIFGLYLNHHWCIERNASINEEFHVCSNWCCHDIHGNGFKSSFYPYYSTDTRYNIISNPPEAVTLQILCALSLISFGMIYVCEWKSWSNILLGKEISPRAKYMNQSTSHPSTNYLNRSNQVGGAPGPWCPVARAGALLLTEPTVWSRIQIWTQLQFIVSSVACKDTACTNFIFNIGEMFLDVLTCLSGHHKCLNDQGNMFMSSINIYFEFPFLSWTLDQACASTSETPCGFSMFTPFLIPLTLHLFKQNHRDWSERFSLADETIGSGDLLSSWIMWSIAQIDTWINSSSDSCRTSLCPVQ